MLIEYFEVPRTLVSCYWMERVSAFRMRQNLCVEEANSDAALIDFPDTPACFTPGATRHSSEGREKLFANEGACDCTLHVKGGCDHWVALPIYRAAGAQSH